MEHEGDDGHKSLLTIASTGNCLISELSTIITIVSRHLSIMCCCDPEYLQPEQGDVPVGERYLFHFNNPLGNHREAAIVSRDKTRGPK